MSLKAIDYSKSSVYRLVYNNITYYIGSTTNFRNRKGQHKRSCIKEREQGYNYPIYEFIRSNGGWDNWSMVLIEYLDCKNGEELRRREQYWFDEYKETLLNKNKPHREKSQWNFIRERAPPYIVRFLKSENPDNIEIPS
jgi:hypothetical protein